MSRISSTFDSILDKNRKALIPYFTAGDPSPKLTVPLMHSMVEGGADIIELGIPFSDPMAEGPVIQRACERALKFNVNIKDVLGFVKLFRKHNNKTPVVLMGYANPIEKIGEKKFTELSYNAGVDGVIVVDYPPEECESFSKLLKNVGIDLIFLLAPTSTEERIKQVAEIGGGFSYYVSLRGVTGAKHIDVEEVSNRIKKIRQYVDLPIGVGFGIRDSDTAKAVASVSDAVVIGSRIIEEIEKSKNNDCVKSIKNFLLKIRKSIDQIN